MPVTQNLPRRNHYIPQFYLKNFSQDQENIYRLDKFTGEIRLLPIPVVGFQNDLYTYRNNSGEQESLESTFSEIEARATQVIQMLRSGQTIADQDKADLSLFLSCQMVRTPAFQTQLESAHAELHSRIMRMSISMTPPERIQEIMNELGEAISPDQARDAIEFATDVQRSRFNFEFPPEYWIKHMLKLTTDIYPLFYICDWEIRHSVTPFGYLTSDHPFLLIPGEKPHSFDGVGLLTPKAKKVIPLTADICLIAHEPSEDPVILHTVADKDFFRMINQATIRNAERYVFSPSEGKVEKHIKQDNNLLRVPRRYIVT